VFSQEIGHPNNYIDTKNPYKMAKAIKQLCLYLHKRQSLVYKLTAQHRNNSIQELLKLSIFISIVSKVDDFGSMYSH